MRILRVILIIAVLSAEAFGQAWSGILSSSRAIDWSGSGLPATLPTGETTTNRWTPPTRTQCGSTIAGGASLATIEAAMNSCTPGHYVLLGAGHFSVPSGSQLTFYDRAGDQHAFLGVTLRGSGPMSTFIDLAGTIQYGQVFPTGSGNVTAFGSNTVTLSSTSGLSVGNVMDISQCDTGRSGSTCQTGSGTDNGGVFVCRNLANCALNVFATSNRAQHQIVMVTNIAGSVVTFTPALRLQNWSTSQNPTADWINTKYYGNGLENMTIDERGNTNDQPIMYRQSYASWQTGTRIIGSNASATSDAVIMTDCYNCLYKDNYIENYALSIGGSRITLNTSNVSDSLLLNNINVGGDSWEGLGSSSGSIFAYNYGIYGKTEYLWNALFEHDAGSAFWLHEGNQNGKYNDDDTNGSHNFVTLFRNYFSGDDPPYVTSPSCNAVSCFGVKMDAFARFSNIIGNVVGGSRVTNYEATPGNGVTNNYAFGFDLNGASDPLVESTSMRWGNCDSATGTCRFQGSEVPTSLSGNAAPYVNSVPASQTLPASFFLGSSAPTWWGACTSWNTFPTDCAAATSPPFPVAGPDVTGGPYVNGHAYDIPAATAYKNLPIDTSYQNSYSITGSSWSGGTETLTVSGLPTGSHTMGGFQITGNANCNSPANSEFLMTGSSTTQIQYALGSNPGSCVGGTVKWPDVRQFDARVYQQAQSGSSPGINISPLAGFGTQKVNTAATPQNLTVTSNGTADLVISSIVKGGTNASDFTVTNNCPGTPLPPTTTCTITVGFTPAATGARSGTITVTSNAPTSPNVVTMTGTGTAPVVSLTPASNNFGNVTQGTTSAGAGFLLSNTGDAVLSISGISLTGTDSGQFGQSGNCGASLSPSTSCTITVTFSPSSTGAKSAALSISDDASGSPHTSSLSGTGVPASGGSNSISVTGGISISGGVVIK